VVSLSVSAGLLLTVPGLPVVGGFALLVVVAVTGFILLPSLRLTQSNARVVAAVTPALVWVLHHVHGPLDRLALLANRFREMPLHSRLYEKEDLLELIERQKGQVDNRIHADDLELVQRALTFSDTRAADIVQPRKEAHLVNADDSIGPILLDQLHKQKQGSFLVYKDTKDTIIGSLALSDAVTAKHGGRVFDLIRNDLIFVHEDFTARQVLDAFHKTGHQVAVAINNAEEFIGVITLDHLLRSLLGEAQDDESIAYGDRSAVAAYKPKADKREEETGQDKSADIEPAGEPGELPAENTEAAETTSSSLRATEVVE
jgi:CBS domain containing-hemolysin-like protein